MLDFHERSNSVLQGACFFAFLVPYLQLWINQEVWVCPFKFSLDASYGGCRSCCCCLTESATTFSITWQHNSAMYLVFLSIPKVLEIAYPGVSPTLKGICAIPACYHGAYFRDVYAIALVNYLSVHVTPSVKRFYSVLYY